VFAVAREVADIAHDDNREDFTGPARKSHPVGRNLRLVVGAV
jgi:hypothetical protein